MEAKAPLISGWYPVVHTGLVMKAGANYGDERIFVVEFRAFELPGMFRSSEDLSDHVVGPADGMTETKSSRSEDWGETQGHMVTSDPPKTDSAKRHF